MENQTNLKGDIIIITTTSILDNIDLFALNRNAFRVLTQFIINPRPLSIPDIRKLMPNSMHINTMRNSFNKLKDLGFIQLIAKGCGHNKLAHKYQATELGISAWKNYQDSEKLPSEKRETQKGLYTSDTSINYEQDKISPLSRVFNYHDFQGQGEPSSQSSFGYRANQEER